MYVFAAYCPNVNSTPFVDDGTADLPTLKAAFPALRPFNANPVPPANKANVVTGLLIAVSHPNLRI